MSRDLDPARDAPSFAGLSSAQSDTLQRMLGAIGDLVFELTPEGRFATFFGAQDLLFASPESFLGRNLRDALPPEVAERAAQALHGVLADGAMRTVEYSLPLPEPHWFEARLTPAGNGHVLAVVRDIHARKLAEEERAHAEQLLRESEQRFRHMADHAPVMLWMTGTDALCEFFNRGWLEFTGRSMEEEMGNGWAEGVHPEDFQECMDVFLSSFVARRPFRMEYRLRRADGSFRWILDQGAPRLDGERRFLGFIGSCIDVTEIKAAADEVQRMNADLERRVRERTEELSAALREREVLLREIHHRVKNNLQIISSLLNLQARHLDERGRELALEAQSRVRSIALVHEKLYESKNLAEVDFRSYVADLMRSIEHAAGNSNIVVRTRVEPVHMAVNHAIACGLIINELVTNAFKHAFSDGRSGQVQVTLCRDACGRLELGVSDDGCGIAEDVDVDKPLSLGLELVRTLARQLGSDLEVGRDGGARFVIRFEEGK
jgi:PAS domain S-box-containing protein